MAETSDVWVRHESGTGSDAKLNQHGKDEDELSPPPEHQEMPSQPLAESPSTTLALGLVHPEYGALHAHHAVTDSELAEMHHQHQQMILQAQQQQQAQEHAQHHYEAEARGRSGPLAHGDADLQSNLQQHGVELHLPSLHEADFDRDRKEKRKVANREAARRMRQRRAQQLTHLDQNNNDLKTEISTLQQQLTHLATHNRELMAENATLKQDLLNIKAALSRVGPESNVSHAEGRPAEY